MEMRIKYILLVVFSLWLHMGSAQVGVREDGVDSEVDSIGKYPRHLFVKTNVVNWVLLVSNVEVEADVARNWSVSLPVAYSAWNYFTSGIKFRTLSFYPAVRYWISEGNEEWYVGAHLGVAWYNFALGGEFRTQDRGGHTPALGGGISVGYRMPLKSCRKWKLEFSLGVGVYRLHHDKFLNVDNGQWVCTRRKVYFGPDCLSVSFVYTIDLKKNIRLK